MLPRDVLYIYLYCRMGIRDIISRHGQPISRLQWTLGWREVRLSININVWGPPNYKWSEKWFCLLIGVCPIWNIEKKFNSEGTSFAIAFPQPALMLTSYYLPLNRTNLILLHSQRTDSTERKPIVVQVTTKMARERVIDEMTQFYLSHRDITVRCPPETPFLFDD